MNRNTTPIIATRSARFTSADHSEIELATPFDGLAGDPRNGEKMTAFYSAELYAARVLEHGSEIYPEPEPFTDGHFRR